MKFCLPLRNSMICMILVFASCSTARIHISVLEPAKITIPASIKRVSLFPGAGIPDLPGVIDSIKEVDLEPGYNYNRVKRGYADGAYDAMSASPRFLKVVPADTAYENLLASGMISWDELRLLCTRDSTDAVLILKKAVSHDKLSRFNVPGMSCGIYYQLVNRTKWSFYRPFLQEESMDIVFADTSVYEQFDENCLFPFPLRDIPGTLYDACFQTGFRMGEQISPTWNDQIGRILFAGPGKELRYASELAMNNRWNQAAAIWNDLADSRNRRLASHASFNLALAWEQDDDLYQAVLWISHADSLQSSGKTLAYKNILEKRLKSRDLLDRQMTGN